MRSDRNQPGFGPAFWVGLVYAQPPYEIFRRHPCFEEASPARQRPRGRFGRRLLDALAAWRRQEGSRRA